MFVKLDILEIWIFWNENFQDIELTLIKEGHKYILYVQENTRVGNLPWKFGLISFIIIYSTMMLKKKTTFIAPKLFNSFLVSWCSKKKTYLVKKRNINIQQNMFFVNSMLLIGALFLVHLPSSCVLYFYYYRHIGTYRYIILVRIVLVSLIRR